jgi:hypothetical protein
MHRADEIVMFPPFVSNKRDPLYAFSDGIFHRACVGNDALLAQATKFANEARDRNLPMNRACVICRKLITEPEDYFGAGYLTSDEANPAFAFNFVQFHKRHFAEWKQASEFRSVIEWLVNSAAWDGPKVVFAPLPTWDR